MSWKSPGNLLGWICRHPVSHDENIWCIVWHITLSYIWQILRTLCTLIRIVFVVIIVCHHPAQCFILSYSLFEWLVQFWIQIFEKWNLKIDYNMTDTFSSAKTKTTWLKLAFSTKIKWKWLWILFKWIKTMTQIRRPTLMNTDSYMTIVQVNLC